MQKIIYIPKDDKQTLPTLANLAQAAGMSDSQYIRWLIFVAYEQQQAGKVA